MDLENDLAKSPILVQKEKENLTLQIEIEMKEEKLLEMRKMRLTFAERKNRLIQDIKNEVKNQIKNKMIQIIS